MMEMAVQRRWLSQLLFGRLGLFLRKDATGLLIATKNAEQLVSISELAEPVHISPGSLWSRLSMKTLSQTMSFGGLRKEPLSQLADNLNARLRLYAEDLLESESAGLQSVTKQISSFLNQNAYARDSRRRKLVVDAEKAVTVLSHRFWKLFASTALREAGTAVSQFIHHSERLVQEANTLFVDREIEAYKEFFDSVEKNPLTEAQRKASVINEDSNLVLAGAGTGKTSTMIGRAGYLLASGQARPGELLMLAFAKKAAEEMQERQDKCLGQWLKEGTPTIKTFHAIGLEIISKVERRRPALSSLAEDEHAFARFIDGQLTEQLKVREYQNKVVRFFTSYLYPYRNPFDFKSMQEYNNYVRRHELRTLQGEPVKSFEECEIANFLLQHGITYRYEEAYVINTAGPDFRQYRPDFFLPDYGIYIEHFALDRQGRPPSHFDQRRYLDGIKWKRELHGRNNTKLIETYSYLKREGRLQTFLAESLRKVGVELSRRSDEDLLAELRERGKVSEFAVLLSEFLTLFKQSYMKWEELWGQAKAHIDAERLCVLLEIFHPVFEAYQGYLKKNKEIDFADMIGKAIEHIETGRFHSPYTHILVDEFQDISSARGRLALAMVRQKPESVLFAVGDDWQSIYRFTGSDIGFTKHFEKLFGASAITSLDLTFRFNMEISDVASAFILKNPEQIKKTIGSLSQVKEPAISLVRVLDADKGLRLALGTIRERSIAKSRKKTSVLVLARYNFVLDQWNSPAARRRLKDEFPMTDISLMTVHSAKGKEADYVITVGLEKGKHGFPSEKETDSILEFLLPESETFPFAEERRLFYVALTRARHRVYLVYNPLMASSFIKELTNKGYLICSDEFPKDSVYRDIPDVSCPSCADGSLVPRTSKSGPFIGCNHYPYCKYTERTCPQCVDPMPMKRVERFKVCINEKCGEVQPICPSCGAVMVKRNGPYGTFWGCLNYRTNSDFVCTHTENQILVPARLEKAAE